MVQWDSVCQCKSPHRNRLPIYQYPSPYLKHFVDSVLWEPGKVDHEAPYTKRGVAYLKKPQQVSLSIWPIVPNLSCSICIKSHTSAHFQAFQHRFSPRRSAKHSLRNHTQQTHDATTRADSLPSLNRWYVLPFSTT